MDSIIIPTRPLLQTVKGQRYHLLLSHELDDPAVRDFYRREGECGSGLILDNSAHEKQEGEDLSVILRQAKDLRATEIVIPDVLFDGEKTLYRARTSLTALSKLCDQGRFDDSSVPRLMLVPQGRTKALFEECLWELVSFVTDLRVSSPHAASWQFSIGVSKDYNDYWGDNDYLFPFLRDIALPASHLIQAEVHLLGWPKPLPVLAEIGKAFYWQVRSTDSARPITFAMFGIDLSRGVDVEYPKRPPKFFDRGIPPEFAPLLRTNVKVYRDLVQGILPHD